MYSRKYIFFLPIVVIFIAIYAFDAYAQNKGERLLHSLQTKFNSIKDLSAEFVQYTDGRKDLSGKFFYERGNKIRIDLKNIVLVTDGKTTWNYNKIQNKLIIDNYDPDNASILSLKNFIDVIPSKCNIKEKVGNSGIIVLIPDSAGLYFSRAEIKINSEDLIDNLSVEDNNGHTIQISISDYKLNSGLSGSLFHLNPPKGSKVIDLR